MSGVYNQMDSYSSTYNTILGCKKELFCYPSANSAQNDCMISTLDYHKSQLFFPIFSTKIVTYNANPQIINSHLFFHTYPNIF